MSGSNMCVVNVYTSTQYIQINAPNQQHFNTADTQAAFKAQGVNTHNAIFFGVSRYIAGRLILRCYVATGKSPTMMV